MAMKLTFERKLPLVLFFVFFLMAITGVVFYQNTVSLQDALTEEKRSQDVVLSLENTMTYVLNAESEMRAFIDTGNTTYVEQYDAARRGTDQNLRFVRQEISPTETTSTDVGRLDTALSDFWNLTGERIERRKQLGPAARDIDLSQRDTRAALDGIRAAIDRIKASELAAMSARDRSLEQSLYRTIWLLIVAAFAGLVSLAIANMLVWSEGRKRAAAEERLIETNVDLEKTVEERTEELRLANEDLRLAAVEREHLLENERRAREESEIANRLRDEFMATVSHELRTPLNSILGWARLLRSGSLDDEQATKAVSTIIKNSEAQNRLIEDLLDVARIISGKLQLEIEPISISEVIEHSVESVLPSADNRNIRLTVELSDNLGEISVAGDRGRLEQVFSNLLINGVKFTPNGGAVTVTAARSGDDVEVTVRDTGKGISPDFLPLVFERFRQDIGNEKNNGGLGLGLAIVRNLVEMHGGTVEAKSEGEDRGAEFTVRLPIKK